MNTQQDEFFQTLGDNLTPEQAAQLLEMGQQGDTGTAPETGGEPDASTAGDEGESGQADEQQDQESEGEQPEGEQPVLLAKDGKHTIPYEKLSEAREGEKHWKSQAEAALQDLEALKAEAQERADSGQAPTQVDQNAELAQQAIDEGVDPNLFGDFTEADLAKGVNALIESKLEERLSKMEQQQSATTAAEAHYNAIYEAHPDADSIGESQELQQWIDAQPSHIQLGVQSVLEKGSAQQVIDLFSSFKEATGKTQQAGDQSSQDDVKAAAKEAVNNAEAPAPASLSDIPGGRASGAPLEEQMANMEGKDMLDRMQEMDPDKIDSLLNRMI